MDSLITLLISGIALYIIKKNLAGREAEERQLRKDTERENVLILRSINAIGKLTLANSIALKDGKVNGEMSSAMREYEDVDRELYNYLLEINSKKR